MFHRILAFLTTLALFAACAPVHARPLVDVSLVDRDTGESLARYPHRGDLWVAGSPGHRYSVRLRNHSAERVLVVRSITQSIASVASLLTSASGTGHFARISS